MASIHKVCVPDLAVKITKWKVKKGSRVSKGSILALYEEATDGVSSGEVKSSLKLKSSVTGTVDDILVEAGVVNTAGTVLMTVRQQNAEGCSHPTVMKDMCAVCGADLREVRVDPADKDKVMSASVAMVHNIPELIVSQDQAQELGREDVSRLLKTRKLVLLVDLDQTLIHTTHDNVPADLKDVFHFRMREGPRGLWYHTRLRPHTRPFLEKMLTMYELHICTFGLRRYAHTIARLIDPDEKMFSHRILSRDECFDPRLKTANLKALFPCGDAMVCIIDDREDVWNNAPNMVKVKPYRFFKGTADINAPPGQQKSEVAKKETDVERSPKKKMKIEKDVKAGLAEGETVGRTERERAGDENSDKHDSKEEAEYGDRKEQVVSLEADNKDCKNDVKHTGKNALVCMNSGLEDEKNEEVKCVKEEKLCSKGEFEDIDFDKEQTKDSKLSEIENKVSGDSEMTGEVETDIPEQAESMEVDVTEQSGDKDGDDQTESKKRNVEYGKEEETKEPDSATDGEWEDEDDYLLHLGDILTRIHSAYYSMVDKKVSPSSSIPFPQDSVPDLKSLIPYMKRKTLRGCVLVFSSLVPLHKDFEKSQACVVARSLGAEVQQEVDGTTTHLVAVKAGTRKHKKALKRRRVKIVSDAWLWACNERWERCDERLFPLETDAESE